MTENFKIKRAREGGLKDILGSASDTWGWDITTRSESVTCSPFPSLCRRPDSQTSKATKIGQHPWPSIDKSLAHNS